MTSHRDLSEIVESGGVVLEWTDSPPERTLRIWPASLDALRDFVGILERMAAGAAEDSFVPTSARADRLERFEMLRTDRLMNRLWTKKSKSGVSLWWIADSEGWQAAVELAEPLLTAGERSFQYLTFPGPDQPDVVLESGRPAEIRPSSEH